MVRQISLHLGLLWLVFALLVVNIFDVYFFLSEFYSFRNPDLVYSLAADGSSSILQNSHSLNWRVFEGREAQSRFRLAAILALDLDHDCLAYFLIYGLLP